MDILDGEARPPVEALLAREGETERDRRGHEQVGDDSGRAGRVPVDAERAENHAAPGALTDRRHTWLRTGGPSSGRNRPARPRPSSQAGPSGPSRNAALAATSALRAGSAAHD